MSASDLEIQSPLTRTLPAVAFAALVGTMAMVSFNAVIGPIVRILQLEEWHAGLAMTIAGLFWMLLARQWGSLSDHIGRRRVLLIALSACTVMYLGLAVFVDWAMRNPPAVLLSVSALIVLRSAIGAFHSALPSTAAAAVADQSPPGMRASAMAKLGAANSAGMMLGPAVAGWLATAHLSWALYGAAALPLLAWGVIWCLLPATTPVAKALGPGRAGSKPKMKFFDPRIRIPAVVAFVAMMSVAVAQVSIGFFAMDRLSLAPEDGAKVAGFALTAVGVGLFSAQSIYIRMKVQRPILWIMAGTLISAAGFLTVAMISNSWQLLAAYCLAAFGMGFTVPSIQALAADSVDAQEQGIAAGTIASMQGMGMVVGPIIGTTLYRLSPAAPYLLVGTLLIGLSAVVSILRK